MASRDLTYLGNPFQQGLGKATVVDTSGVADDFIKGMKSVRANRKADNDAIKKEKAAQKKSVEDYKVDYFIGHQAHFQGAIDEVRKKLVDLDMRGVNLNNYKNPEVREVKRRQIEIDSDAKLSKDIATYIDKGLNLTPEQRSKIKADSYKGFVDFLDLPFDEQVKAFKNGTMAKLEVLNELPITKLKDVAAQINSGVEKTSYTNQADLDSRQEADIKRMQDIVRQTITPDMINSTDPATIKQQIDDYVEVYGGMINKTYEDLKAKSQDAAKLKENENKNAIEWAKIRNAQAKTALDKAKWSATQRAFEDYDGFVQEVVDGNLDNIRTLEDIMTVTIDDGDKDVEYKPQVYVTKMQPKTGAGFNPLIIDIDNQEEYVEIIYPKDANIPTKKIKVKNKDGSVNTQGVQELKGVGRISFNNQAAKSGVKNTGKAGAVTGNQSGGTTTSSSNRTSTQNGASGGVNNGASNQTLQLFQ